MRRNNQYRNPELSNNPLLITVSRQLCDDIFAYASWAEPTSYNEYVKWFIYAYMQFQFAQSHKKQITIYPGTLGLMKIYLTINMRKVYSKVVSIISPLSF